MSDDDQQPDRPSRRLAIKLGITTDSPQVAGIASFLFNDVTIIGLQHQAHVGTAALAPSLIASESFLTLAKTAGKKAIAIEIPKSVQKTISAFQDGKSSKMTFFQALDRIGDDKLRDYPAPVLGILVSRATDRGIRIVAADPPREAVPTLFALVAMQKAATTGDLTTYPDPVERASVQRLRATQQYRASVEMNAGILKSLRQRASGGGVVIAYGALHGPGLEQAAVDEKLSVQRLNLFASSGEMKQAVAGNASILSAIFPHGAPDALNEVYTATPALLLDSGKLVTRLGEAPAQPLRVRRNPGQNLK